LPRRRGGHYAGGVVVRLLVAAAIVAGGAGPAAAAGPPAATLRSGQTRWFLPGDLRPGAQVVCVVAGHAIAASVPAPRAGAVRGVDRASRSGGVLVAISLDVRPSGALEARCGSAVASSAIRRSDPRYGIDQNGFAALPGATTLARVQRLFPGGVTGAAGSTCRVGWRALGLVATFAGSSCPASGRLLGATVTGRRWSSLTGVHLGDPAARMAWESQDARLLSGSARRGTWLLGRARSGSRLVAVVADGRVVRLVLQGR
jgi:hypothetical protein